MMTNKERSKNISILLTVCIAFDKIADIVDGDIDHLDRDDAMDLLYEIKSIVKGTERESDES